jgi:molybdate transport repressor ModE-like protein
MGLEARRRISLKCIWEILVDTALVEKQRGGNMGGRTILTGEGKKWVKAYTKFRTDVEKAVGKAYEKRIEELLK